MPTPTAAVEVSGLVKTYGDVRAVDGLDLRVEVGTVAAILGPNGAGKTTTVEILEGYRRRDGGDVRVLGLDPAGRLRGRRDQPLPGVRVDRGNVVAQGLYGLEGQDPHRRSRTT